MGNETRTLVADFMEFESAHSATGYVATVASAAVTHQLYITVLTIAEMDNTRLSAQNT